MRMKWGMVMRIRKWMGILGISLMSFGQVANAATFTDDMGQVTSFISPIYVPGELLAPFNQTRDGYCHEGIDIRTAMYTPIFAIADGVITKAAPDSKGVDQGGGHMIFLDLGNELEVRYMHLAAYAVQTGDRVYAGQLIGFTGNSGDSTTPHLHFEYRMNNEPVNPTFIFENSGMILTSSTYESIEQEYMETWTKVNEIQHFYVIQE
ncbi:MAG: M23 family metallopeptidase [Cellulosilyticum sp.]|nr:M23 family metallopeptidase [Cellulosilyticum sp.]